MIPNRHALNFCRVEDVHSGEDFGEFCYESFSVPASSKVGELVTGKIFCDEEYFRKGAFGAFCKSGEKCAN